MTHHSVGSETLLDIALPTNRESTHWHHCYGHLSRIVSAPCRIVAGDACDLRRAMAHNNIRPVPRAGGGRDGCEL